MLPTAIVYVMDSESGRHEYRALLDQGSQVNVIKTSRSASTFLACRVEQSFLFSGPLTRVDWCASVRIEIASRCSGFHISLSLIMDRWICPISSFQIPESAIHVPPHITLADPQFSIPRDVDLIIGNGQLCEIMSVGRHRLERELPSLLKSQLDGYSADIKWPTYRIGAMQRNYERAAGSAAVLGTGECIV